jgi:hypothetical protein
VDAGVRRLVERTLGVEDGGGLLRGRRTVEVHQRPIPTHPAGEDREVLADPGDVDGGHGQEAAANRS